MNARLLLLLTAALAPALSACGPAIRSGTHFAPGARLAGGMTFAWDQESDRAMGDPRLEGNPFFEARLHEAIEWELSLRGIHQTDGSPDLRLHHHLSLSDHQWEQEVSVEAGVSRVETFTAEEGSVVVHITDARTGQDVWVGWAQADIDAAITGPDAMRGWVYAIVGEMFEDWAVPARTVEP